MRTSKYLLATLKQTPANAEVVSHQLMLRAGMIRPLGSGLYTYLPTGLKVLKKIEKIVREEMDKAGAIEMLMPMVQPADLWVESGRYVEYGPELLRFKDRGDREFVLGPTHEEIITDLVRREITSYKQLPLNLYQIQTKFRDEVRPRFGVMRAREFLMKDAYSFHMDKDSLDEVYQAMHQAYCNIFDRLNLRYKAVLADSGSIGGYLSHEFQVLAQSGEDEIVYSNSSDFAANIELAQAPTLQLAPEELQPLQTLDTPNEKTIDALVEKFNLDIKKTVKTLLVKAVDGADCPMVALILRGDHRLNKVKAEKLALVRAPLEMADEGDIKNLIGASIGSLGVVNLKVPMIVDNSVAVLQNFVCGANQDGKHFVNVNWERDATFDQQADIRNIEAGDKSPCGQGEVEITRGIEVGHIFQLGDKYTKALKAQVQGEDGNLTDITMGCYGVGVSRILAAAIEQNNDDRGIILNDNIAPFNIGIIPMNMHKSTQVADFCNKLYDDLKASGFDVLFDDRKERPGVMFADFDLIGVSHVVIVGEKNLEQGIVEYKNRKVDEKIKLNISELKDFLQQNVNLA